MSESEPEVIGECVKCGKAAVQIVGTWPRPQCMKCGHMGSPKQAEVRHIASPTPELFESLQKQLSDALVTIERLANERDSLLAAGRAAPTPAPADAVLGERERFEAWTHRTHGGWYGTGRTADGSDNEYVDAAVRFAWKAWQAATLGAAPDPIDAVRLHFLGTTAPVPCIPLEHVRDIRAQAFAEAAAMCREAQESSADLAMRHTRPVYVAQCQGAEEALGMLAYCLEALARGDVPC